MANRIGLYMTDGKIPPVIKYKGRNSDPCFISFLPNGPFTLPGKINGDPLMWGSYP